MNPLLCTAQEIITLSGCVFGRRRPAISARPSAHGTRRYRGNSFGCVEFFLREDMFEKLARFKQRIGNSDAG